VGDRAWTGEEQQEHPQWHLIPRQVFNCFFNNRHDMAYLKRDDLIALMRSPPPDNRLIGIQHDPLRLSQAQAWDSSPQSPLMRTPPASLINQLNTFRDEEAFFVRNNQTEPHLYAPLQTSLWLALAFGRPDYSFAALMKIGRQLVSDEMMFSALTPAWGNIDYLKALVAWHKRKGSLLTMIQSNQYQIFVHAARYGHVAILKYLAELAPDELRNMIRANRYAAFREAAACGHVKVLEYLAEQAPDELLVMMTVSAEPDDFTVNFNAFDFDAFIGAAEGGQLEVLKYIVAVLKEKSPETLPIMIKQAGSEALDFAIENGHHHVADYLIGFPSLCAYAAYTAHIKEEKYFGSFAYRRLSELRAKKIAFEAENKENIPFDVSHEEAEQLFYVLYYCIQRNGKAIKTEPGLREQDNIPFQNENNSLEVDNPEIAKEEVHLLLSIPSVSDCVIEEARNAPEEKGRFVFRQPAAPEGSMLLRLAKVVGNQEAAMQLLDIPEVLRVAQENYFYQKDMAYRWPFFHGGFDDRPPLNLNLETLAKNRQIKMTILQDSIDVSQQENIPEIKDLQQKYHAWQEVIFVGRVYQDTLRNNKNIYVPKNIPIFNQQLQQLALSQTTIRASIKLAIATRRAAVTAEATDKANNQLQKLTKNLEDRIQFFKEKIKNEIEFSYLNSAPFFIEILINKITESDGKNRHHYQKINWQKARKDFERAIQNYHTRLINSTDQQSFDGLELKWKRETLKKLSYLINPNHIYYNEHYTTSGQESGVGNRIGSLKQVCTDKEALLRTLAYFDIYDTRIQQLRRHRGYRFHQAPLRAGFSLTGQCLDLLATILQVPARYRLTAVEGARFLDRIGHFKRKYHLEQKPATQRQYGLRNDV
jgi:hypothetical protein